MKLEEIKNHLNKHCRFKLKSGKEVYGVLREDNSRLLFSSSNAHDNFLKGNPRGLRNEGFPINEEDILLIEALVVE